MVRPNFSGWRVTHDIRRRRRALPHSSQHNLIMMEARGITSIDVTKQGIHGMSAGPFRLVNGTRMDVDGLEGFY